MIGRWLPLLLTLLVVSAAATPVVWLQSTVARARDCFASQREPRGADLPDCVVSLGVIERLEGIPFMAQHARRLREEMTARMAFMRYVDASVGAPSRDGVARARPGVARAHQSVTWGTGRLMLDELGPPIPVLGPAEWAMQVGDAAGLDEAAERHAHHAATRRALEEAWLRGAPERVIHVAERHVGRPDEDLRLTVAAMLCAMGDAERGMREARAVEKRRAADRKANFSRHFGSARVVVEACAHLAGRAAPAIPSYGHAGEWDHRARLLALRMRLFREQNAGCDMADPNGCRRDPAFAENLTHVIERLRHRRPRAYRLETLATVVEAFAKAEGARPLAAELEDEPRHEDRMVVAVRDWVDPPADEPFLPAADWRRAARHVDALLAAEAAGEGAPAAGEGDALARAGRAMWWRAAMAHALAGDLARADEALDRAAPADPPRRQLGAALAALVAGDRRRARGRIAEAAPEARRASLLPAALAMPDVEEAEARLPARDDLALAEARAWLELGLGLVPAPRRPHPPRVAVVGPPDLPQAPAARAAALDQLLARWAGWLRGSPEERRACRYLLWEHRGDLPEHAALPWIHAAGQLVEGDEETEVWLDAALALDRGRLSLRRYAMLRWRAAAWREDELAARRWRKRYRALAERSVDPAVAELLREAGL